MARKRNLNQFWFQLDHAFTSFCLDVSLERIDPSKMVTALVGEELEWCGSSSFLFLANQYVKMSSQFKSLDDRCKQLDTMLHSETTLTSNLRKQLKLLQSSSQDNEWQLQEELAHMNTVLLQEKESNQELRQKVAISEAKLIEIEMYLTSDHGTLSLQLEQDLAASKLRIAELEAEKDELEMQIRRRRPSLLAEKELSSFSGYRKSDSGSISSVTTT